MDLVERTYAMTASFPASERFGLTQQLRRSAVSIASNIAEGHGRLHRADFVHHLSIASGSLRELETQILLAVRLGFLSAQDVEQALALADEVGRMIAGLIRAVRSYGTRAP